MQDTTCWGVVWCNFAHRSAPCKTAKPVGHARCHPSYATPDDGRRFVSAIIRADLGSKVQKSGSEMSRRVSDVGGVILHARVGHASGVRCSWLSKSRWQVRFGRLRLFAVYCRRTTHYGRKVGFCYAPRRDYCTRRAEGPHSGPTVV